MTDRMERVREKADDFACRHYLDMPGHDMAAIRGFVAGHEQALTRTGAEWEAMREKVARVVSSGAFRDADATMTALGFRREGEW